MDPFSIAGGIIAVLQALKAVTVGIQSLADLRKAPAEYLDLHNELTTAIGYLEMIHTNLDALTASSAPLPTPDLTQVHLVLAKLENDVKELQGIMSQTEKRPANSLRGGKLSVSKIKWTLQVDKITRIRDKVRLDRQHLVEAFCTIQQTQSLAQARLVLNIQRVYEADRRHLNQKIDSMSDSLANIRPSLQEVVDEFRATAGRCTTAVHIGEGQGDRPPTSHRGRVNAPGTLGSSVPATDRASEEVSQPERPPNRDSVSRAPNHRSSNLLFVDASIKTNCPIDCRCQCHRSRSMSSPGMVAALAGRLLLRYSGISAFKTAQCDYEACLNTDKFAIRLNYLLPRWALSYAFSMAATWNSVCGLTVRLQVPRVISRDHEVWRCIGSDNLSAMQRLLSENKIHPTDIRQEDGVSLFLFALYTRSWAVIDFFSRFALDVDSADETGRTPSSEAYFLLHIRCEPQLPQSERLLIQNILGASSCNLASAVHMAVLAPRKTSVLAALECDPIGLNDRDLCGATPLHWAASQGDLEAIQILTSRGADVEARDRIGRTPLHWAAMFGPARSARALLDAGSDTEARDFIGDTPIALTLMPGRFGMARFLLYLGASASGTDVYGNGLLHRVLLWHMECSRAGLIDGLAASASLRLFVEHGANVNQPNAWGKTAVALAVSYDSPILLRTLLELGAKLEVIDHLGRSVLHFAATYATVGTIKTLREAGLRTIDPDLQDAKGRTAWQIMQRRISSWDHNIKKATAKEALEFLALLTEAEEQYDQYLDELDRECDYEVTSFHTSTYEDNQIDSNEEEDAIWEPRALRHGEIGEGGTAEHKALGRDRRHLSRYPPGHICIA